MQKCRGRQGGLSTAPQGRTGLPGSEGWCELKEERERLGCLWSPSSRARASALAHLELASTVFAAGTVIP